MLCASTLSPPPLQEEKLWPAFSCSAPLSSTKPTCRRLQRPVNIGSKANWRGILSEPQTHLLMVASKRKRRCLNDGKGYIRKDIRGAIHPDLSRHDFNFGDVSWVNTASYSWWPAQVIDEKSVGPCFKPTRKEEGEVLVRLYGTYSYLYIDPAKNNEEFGNTMRQKNSSMREMLEKTLEKDLSRIKRHHKTKRCPRLSKEHVNAGASTNLEMHERIVRTKETDSVTCVGKTFGARRLKVMQSLALVAPSDSPYC